MNRKFLFSVVLALSLVLLVSCTHDTDVTSPEINETADTQNVYLHITPEENPSNLYADDGSLLISSSYSSLSLDESAYSSYPELEKAITALNQERKNEYEMHYNTLISLIEDEYHLDDIGFSGYTYTEKADIVRCDENIVSVRYSCESFSGGIHGSTYFVTYNIDSKTGDFLTFDDITSDPEAVKTLIAEKVYNSEFKDLVFGNGVEDYFTFTSPENYVFNITDDGITFIFNAYAVAPYYVGTVAVNISFDECSALIRR